MSESTVQTSLSDRIKKITFRVVVGLACLASIALMAWLVRSGQISREMFSNIEQNVRTVDASVVDPANENAVIHVASIKPESAQGTHDAAFGLVDSGFAIRREVAMYQWHEESRGKRTSRRYDYYLDWCFCVNDSSKFHESDGHENPTPDLLNEVLLADDARLGAYRLRDPLFAEKAFKDYDTAEPPYPSDSTLRLVSNIVPLPDLTEAQTAKGWQVVGDNEGYFRGQGSLDEPQLGDMYVSYSRMLGEHAISMIGVQREGAIEPYQRVPGRGYLIARVGNFDARSMVEEARALDRASGKMLFSVALIVLTLGLGVLGTSMGKLFAHVPGLRQLAAHSAFGAGAVIGLIIGGGFSLIIW